MEHVELSEDFKKHYEVWLQKEVFGIRIDWDSLKTVYDIEMHDNYINGKTNDVTAQSVSNILIQTTE